MRHGFSDWLATSSRKFQRMATPVRILLDVASWCAATTAAIILRFAPNFDDEPRAGLLKIIPVVAVLQVLAGTAVGLYRRRWRYGSFDEVAALLATSALTTSSLFLLNEFY